MWICPVCDTKNNTAICPECGFDHSTDLTHLPTFAIPASLPVSPAVLRADREILRCGQCGGSAFSFRMKQRSFFCLDCGTELPRRTLSKLLNAAIEAPRPVRAAAVAACGFHSVLLKTDGTVRAIGSNIHGQCNVDDWKDITSVAAGFSRTVGLRKDGTVAVTDCTQDAGPGVLSEDIGSWTDIIQVDSGCAHILGLKADGTAVIAHDSVANMEPVSRWRDLTAVAAGHWHCVGLKKGGTVVAAGQSSEKQCRTTLWRGITAIAAGGFHTVGLRKDGTAVATGDDYYGQCRVNGWSGLTAIAAGGSHTVGLKADGTVVAVGNNDCGQCDISGWTNVISVAAGEQHTLGLTADGTILAAGSMEHSQCDTKSLMR